MYPSGSLGTAEKMFVSCSDARALFENYKIIVVSVLYYIAGRVYWSDKRTLNTVAQDDLMPWTHHIHSSLHSYTCMDHAMLPDNTIIVLI